jgi:hypothetical protein
LIWKVAGLNNTFNLAPENIVQREYDIVETNENALTKQKSAEVVCYSHILASDEQTL